MARYLGAILIAVTALATRAEALTVDFDFTLPSNWTSYGSAQSYTFVEDGLTLTVGAGTAQGSGVDETGAAVTRAPDGLGVRGAWYDRPLLDGLLGRDVAVFSFDRAVRIEAIRFAGADASDQAQFYTAGGGGLTASSVVDLPSDGALALAGNDEWLGSLFGIGASDWNDEFRIAGIRVSFEDVGDAISATPLPGPLVLLLGGFAVLAASLRRGRAAG